MKSLRAVLIAALFAASFVSTSAFAEDKKPAEEKIVEKSDKPSDEVKLEKPAKNSTKKSKKGFKTMFALLETTEGNVKIKLFHDKMPKTVENFAGVAEGTKEWTDPSTRQKVKKPFYDGLKFHRIVKGFVIQGGCPLGTGTGGPGYQFADEKYPGLSHNKPGIVAMANAGPNTNGSQFYITVKPVTSLDGGYNIFGEVVEGQDVVQKISDMKTDHSERPTKEVKMTKVTIIRE